ncbi:hypothetical protein PQX77_006383 [Marasmius sp. AFHP31]|nr:hypothetical protein PQX77_006383 [Marasmius sp. AFHP31]
MQAQSSATHFTDSNRDTALELYLIWAKMYPQRAERCYLDLVRNEPGNQNLGPFPDQVPPLYRRVTLEHWTGRDRQFQDFLSAVASREPHKQDEAKRLLYAAPRVKLERSDCGAGEETTRVKAATTKKTKTTRKTKLKPKTTIPVSVLECFIPELGDLGPFERDAAMAYVREEIGDIIPGYVLPAVDA